MDELSQTVDELTAQSEQYRGVIEELQGIIKSGRDKNLNDKEIAIIKEKSDIKQTAMKILGDQQKTETQEGGKIEREVLKMVSDSEKELNAMTQEAVKNAGSYELPGVGLVEHINPPTPGGDILPSS